MVRHNAARRTAQATNGWPRSSAAPCRSARCHCCANTIISCAQKHFHLTLASPYVRELNCTVLCHSYVHHRHCRHVYTPAQAALNHAPHPRISISTARVPRKSQFSHYNKHPPPILSQISHRWTPPPHPSRLLPISRTSSIPSPSTPARSTPHFINQPIASQPPPHPHPSAPNLPISALALPTHSPLQRTPPSAQFNPPTPAGHDHPPTPNQCSPTPRPPSVTPVPQPRPPPSPRAAPAPAPPAPRAASCATPLSPTARPARTAL